MSKDTDNYGTPPTYEASEKGRATRKRYRSSPEARAMQRSRRNSNPQHVWGPRRPAQKGIEPEALNTITRLCLELGIDVEDLRGEE